MGAIKAIVIGAGNRGANAYPPYALRHPDELEIVGVAEPDAVRREQFKRTYQLKDEDCYESYEQILAKDKLADLAMICTGDDIHIQPLELAVEKGYHVLLEKPMAPNIADNVKIYNIAKDYDKIISVGHVLRYTPFFKKLKELLDAGTIGRVMSIQHNENVGFWHQAHSFVRGVFRKTPESAPMILAKCCHDMDILLYITGKNCKKVASFGALSHFTRENQPEGAAERCINCKVADSCPYDAVRHYTSAAGASEFTLFPLGCNKASSEAEIIEKLKTHRLGRCVYACDNNVVDHQVVGMEFDDDITVAFTMSAFTNECTRTIKVMGTHGEIGANMEKNLIEVKDFTTGNVTRIQLSDTISGHGGGDDGLMKNLLRAIRGEEECMTAATISLQSHMMAFAAEESRKNSTVVDLKAFTERYGA